MRFNRGVQLSAVIILIVISSVTLSTATNRVYGSTGKLGFLGTSGISVVDASGKPIMLRGVNYPGYDDCGDYSIMHSEQAYRTFASVGFNVVRLPFAANLLLPEAGHFSSTFVTGYFDQDVQLAKKYGLYVVLDMHQWNWAKKFGGCGLPSWMVKQYGTGQNEMRRAITDFWSDIKLQGYLIDIWARLAKHYANEPTVAGYDIFNEPWINVAAANMNHAQKVTAFYLNVIKAIRSVDQNHIIFLEPAVFDTYSLPVKEKNIVWSPHFYPLSFSTKYSSQNVTVLKTTLAAKYKEFVVGFQAPMWIGEFGAFMKDGSADSWLKDAQQLFGQYQVGWAWWAYDQRWSPFPPYLAPNSSA